MIYRFPKLYGDGRSRLAIAIICFVIGQATALGLGAYATRQNFCDPSFGFAKRFLCAFCITGAIKCDLWLLRCHRRSSGRAPGAIIRY